jgi:hypothetical protein
MCAVNDHDGFPLSLDDHNALYVTMWMCAVCRCSTPPDVETNTAICGHDCDAHMLRIHRLATGPKSR